MLGPPSLDCAVSRLRVRPLYLPAAFAVGNSPPLHLHSITVVRLALSGHECEQRVSDGKVSEEWVAAQGPQYPGPVTQEVLGQWLPNWALSVYEGVDEPTKIQARQIVYERMNAAGAFDADGIRGSW